MAVLHRDMKPTDVGVAVFGLSALCVCVLLGCFRCCKRKATENPTEHRILTEGHENLLEEINRLETCLQATHNEKNLFISENEKLAKNVESLKTEKAKLSEEHGNLLADKNRLVTCLQTEKAKLLEEHGNLLADKNRLETCLQVTQAEKEQLRSENENFTKKLNVLQNESDSLNNKYTKLKAEYEKLTQDNDALLTEKEKSLAEITRLTTILNELNEKLEETDQELQKEKSNLKQVQTEAVSTKIKMTLELQKESAKLQQMLKARVCVMCVNNEKLVSVWIALINMIPSQQILSKVHIIPKRLTGILSISEDDFCEARMVVLVGIAEPRNMLISDKEPSQLGVVYREAQKLNKHIFMIYVDDKYSDSLKDSQPYHPSLKTMLENQKPIGELAENNRFLSIKIKDKTSIHKFNGTQSMQISKWIATASAS